MSGVISRIISTKTPLILMVAMSFSYLARVYMKAFWMSKVAKYLCHSDSTIHLSRTDSVVTVGDLESFLDIKSLFLFPNSTVLPFKVPYFFSLRKRWDSRIVFLYYSVTSFLFRGMNVSLMWSCFVSEWTSHIPLLPHLLRPDLSESWFIMNAVTSV